MAADFLHGVETIETLVQGQLIREVKSSIVAIVGIAPIGPKNVLTVVRNSTDDAQFGSPLTGFSIPKALEIIRKEAGGCPVVVVNVFDATTNLTQVTDEVATITNGKLKLGFEPVGAITIKNNDGSASSLVSGTDYSIDAYGNFIALSATAANGTALKFSYKKLNFSSINAAQLVGATDSAGIRSGFQLLDECYAVNRFNPKIIIAPLFSTLSGVQIEMRVKAKKFLAVTLIDAPLSTTVNAVIAGRGPSGTGFNVVDQEAILCYPQIKTYDKATNSNAAFPYSAFLAGVMVANDRDNGFWFSPSNKPILSAVGLERNITFNPSDASTEANALNAVGVITVANDDTFKTWGNRNAAYPSDNSVKNFISLKRIYDQVNDTLNSAAIKYLDLPINQVFIDLVREDGNNYMNSLISRGALLPGSKVLYLQEDNQVADLAAGHITFRIQDMGAPPAERISYIHLLDITLLQSLK